MTVFEGRSAGGQSFAVQYHRVGTGRRRQLRTVMNRKLRRQLDRPGAKPRCGSPHGPRRLGARGRAGRSALRVDGTLRDTRTGNNTGTAMQVQTARLGITAGTTSTTAGTAWFDSFVSTRNSIP